MERSSSFTSTVHDATPASLQVPSTAIAVVVVVAVTTTAPAAAAEVTSSREWASNSDNNHNKVHFSYPVATFVSNFLQRSVSKLRDHLGSHASSCVIYAVSGVPEEAHLSMRSDSGLVTAEFVLVDGDPVSIPTEHHPRVRRGVKGLKKWMKKKRLLPRRAKQQQKQQHYISAEPQLKQQQHQQEIVREDENEAMSASQPSTTRLDEDILPIATVDSSPSRKQKSKTKKKKNRLAWIREIESTRSAGTSASSLIVMPPPHTSSSLETTTAPRLQQVFPPCSPPPATIAEHAS
jgi:hypothetical protein